MPADGRPEMMVIGMDEAFVENAEDDEGREHRGEDQDALPAQRILEHLRRAGEAGGDRRRQVRVLLELGDLVDRIAQRNAGREIERDRHRRLLALVVDLQRTDGRNQLRHRRQRDGHVVLGLHVELGEIGRIDAELRLHFQDDLVVVRRHVDGADLARAIGVVELVADLIDGDAVDRRLLAVDIDRHLRVLDVEVGGDVEQARQLLDLVAHLGRQPVQRLGVAALHHVLILALGNPAADIEVLDRLEERLHARNLAGLDAQPADDRVEVVALLLRLQRNEQAAVIRRRVGPAGADGGIEVFDRGIGLQHLDQRLLPLLHRLEGGVGGGFGDADQEAGVLLREEALRHDHVEVDGAAERRQRHDQHQRLSAPAPSRASIHRRAARNRTSPRRREARHSASSSRHGPAARARTASASASATRIRTR